MRLDDPFMSESDAFSWYMEQDPELRATIVGVAWLEQSPPWDQLRARLEHATRLAPSFRRRPMEVPARLSPPRWVTDPDFDLSWHLRRVSASEPRTDKVVLELARVAAMTGFDRTRPLWEFTLVEGLRGGRAALVMKLHHSLTDGIGGVQLAHFLFDESAIPAFVDAKAKVPAGERFSRPGLVRAALEYRRRRWLGAGSDVLRGLPQVTVRLLRHPGAVSAEWVETARSVGRTVKPVRKVLSPVVTKRGPGRRLHMVTVELAPLREAAHRVGGTVNDGFMAGMTGGLRRYHERHGAVLGDLMVTLPISLRKPDDPLGGNRITLQRVLVPAGMSDPAERIRAMGERCRRARSERSLPLTNAIAGALNLFPSAVVGSMLKHVDFLASDVPGFPRPVYLCGARITGYYPFGPTIGAALNATLFSYQSQCCIGITVDTEAIPDDDVLLACLHEGFAEVMSGAPAEPVGNGSVRKERIRTGAGRHGPVRKEAPC